MKKTKKDEGKLAQAEDYPNLMPAKAAGLTVTKADFETRRIQAMAAVAMGDRRYQNFWRAVRFGNQYMLAIALSGVAANYQGVKLLEALGNQASLAIPVLVGLIAALGIGNVIAWYHLYGVMRRALKDEYKITQFSTRTYTESMSWLTLQHFVVHMALVILACLFWINIVL